MFKLLLMSMIVMPVALGMHAASSRSTRRGLLVMLGLVLAFDVLYMLMLYYLRRHWIG